MPAGLLITDADLPVHVETPHVEAAAISEGSSVTETSRTSTDSLRLLTSFLFLSIKVKGNTLRHSLLTALTETELSQFPFTP